MKQVHVDRIVKEWTTVGGQVIDPFKPASLGVCLMLFCYERAYNGSCFCYSCKNACKKPGARS